MRPCLSSGLLLLPFVAFSPLPSLAQQAEPDAAARFARIVIIQPKPGQEAAFEAGYKRHLAWHASHRDPWTWRAWSFILGDRLDLFMDGTFGHQLGDFDTSVDPVGDAADNATNVEPHAIFLAHGVYELLTPATALPDSSRLLVMTTYWILPGQERTFEDLLTRRLHGISNPPLAWYRLRLGGAGPQYLLFQPAQSFAQAAGISDFFAGTTAAVLAGVVRDIRRELLRYRRDMAYHPSR